MGSTKDQPFGLAGRVRRLLSAAAAALLATSLVVVPALPAQAAGSPDITLAKSAPTEVLAGDPVPFTLTASNANGNPAGYNVLFRDVLPAGVAYVAGSTTPADIGDPTVYANQPSIGLTTLVWSNVADVQAGGSFTLGFSASLNPATYPVNTPLTNSGEAYVNSVPRTVPRVGPNGVPIGTTYTGSAVSPTTTTTVSAVKVSKAMPSPENELVRGVHGGFPQVWTLTVTNNDANATTGTTVTDYVPANLEFLGCGGVDNTPGGAEEYPGSGSLTSVPVIASGCPTPTSVTTVQNPAGLPAGVYTQVVWTLGTIAVGQVTTIKYKAGAPLRANVFPGPAGPDTANLGNNTGASTSETGAERSATNTAIVAGTYTGPVAPATSTSVTATGSLTVTLEDFAIDKSPSGEFSQGTIVPYSLRIRAGEYRDLTNIVLVDTLPSGMCPLGPANYASGAPAECDPVPGQSPSIPYSPAPTVNGDGTTTVPFVVPSMAAGATTVVTFPARARTTYTTGPPTVAGDSFVNVVTGSATSVPTAGSPDPAPPVTVNDTSSSTLTSSGPTIDKTVSAAVAPPGTMNCATATYIEPTTSPDTRPRYEKGDRICFRLEVSFPSTVQTRNPVVSDFLPPGVDYEAGSQVATGANTAPYTFDDAAAVSTNNPIWQVGSGAPRFVALGATFSVTFSGIVNDESSAGQLFDVEGNVMKVRAESTAGVAFSLRDRVDFKILAGPRLSITKGVAGIAPPYSNGPNIDNVQVRAGTVVRYRLDITNNGSTPAQSTQVRDVLPPGITCADVSGISNAGTCLPSSGGITTPVVVWNLPASDVIAVGASRPPLTYDVTIPSGVSVDQSFVNTAGVKQYDSPTNIGGVVTYVPVANIDPSVTPTTGTPAATDTSRVFTPPQVLAKTHTTSLTETSNSATQATIGETVTYTLGVTQPAFTTVYNSLLVDPIPAGQAYVAGSAAATMDGGPLPAGFVLTAGPTDVRLQGPASFANPSATPHVFGILFSTVVLDDPVNVRATNRTNVATLTSTLSDGTAVPPRTITRDVPIVEPNLGVTKTNNAPGGTVEAGQLVTYTVTLTNTSGTNVSIAHDTTASDVIPVGLTYVAGSASNGGTYDAPTRTISWTVGDIAVGGSAIRTFQITVDPGALSGATYVNTAIGVTTSMPGSVPGERTYTRTGPNTITVATPQTTKTVTPGTATVGETVTFTVTTTVPKNVLLYDATIIDTLPTGLTYTGTVSTTCSASPCPATVPAVFRQAGQRLGWHFGDPSVATSPYQLTVVFTARVANIAGNVNGVVRTNTAQLRWGTVDATFPASGLPANSFWDKGSNSPTATVTVVEPSLAVTKTVDAPTLAPGGTRTYTLTLRNTGTSPAFAATVNDPIPNLLVVDGASFAGAGSGVLAGATPTGGGTVTWTVPGPIPVGGSVTLTYTATLAPSAIVPNAQSLPNTASLVSYAGLPGGPGSFGRPYTGNTSTVTVTAAFPRVTVAKTTASGAETGTASIGASFGWQLVLTNTSAVPALAVQAVDTLPTNWTYDAGTATVTPQGGSTTQVDPVVSGQTLTWATGLTLAPGQTITIRFTATPQPGVTTSPGVGPTSPNINSATPSATDATGASGNASGPYGAGPDTAAAIIDSADLRIDKSHAGSFTAGQNGTYTITVTNGGPSAAAGPITVVDTVPAGLTFVSGGSTNGWGACTAVGQTVTCTRAGGLAAAAVTSFPLVVAVPANASTGSYVNNASVSGPTYDPVPGNNTDSDPTNVVTSADLSIVKAVSGPVVAGRDVNWTLEVTNNGPSVSRGPITMTDVLPAGTTYVSATGTGWSCGFATGTVTCTRSLDLLVGVTAPQILLVVSLDKSAIGTLTNTGHVSGTTPDPNSSNDSSTTATPIDTSADLVLTKSHTGSFLAGSQGTYDFQVDNLGPSDAAGALTITDTLPTGLTFASGGGTGGWTCSAAGQLVTCTRAAGLAVGATTTTTIVVDVASGVTGSLVNTATVGSPTPDPVPGNNTDDDDTAVTTEANLSVTKTHTPTPAIAGDQVTYTLTVHNAGSSDAAADVVLEDTLPAGFTVAAVTAGAGWSCPFSVGDTSLTCTRSTSLAAGATAPVVTVTVDVDPSQAAGSYDNEATVGSPTPDPDLSDNTVADPTPVVTRADLALTKTAAAPTVEAGGSTSFTLSVTNNGPSDASGPVTVTDTLPTGMVFVSGGSANGWAACTALGQTVTCARSADLAAGATAGALVIDVTIQSGTADGTLTNTATVSSPTTDPVPGNNTDTADVDVTVAADLALVKTHRESPALAGELLTFDLQVSNEGPSDAVAPLVVTDTLPAKVRYVSAAAPWSCLATGDPLVGQTVTCTLSAGLVGGTATTPELAPLLTIVTSVDADLAPGTVTNAATVDAPGTPDPDTTNNTDTDDVSVSASADLSVVKVSTTPLVVGSQATYTLTVSNAGPSQATDVTVADALPAGLALVTASGPGWDCTASTTTDVDCAIPTLDVGAPTVITVIVDVGPAAYPQVTNTATVDASSPDPDPSNNSSTDVAPVPARVDLAITKTHTAPLVSVGDPLAYTLTVQNLGPTDDPALVTVTDVLPTGLTYVSATGPGWTCAAVGQTVTCTRVGLAIGVAPVLTLTVDVGPEAAPSVTNTATVGSPSTDIDPTNNTAEDPTDIRPVADLTIVKTIESTVVAGELITYRLVVSNLGPSTEDGPIVVTDSLPAGLTAPAASGSGWSCTVTGSDVSCTRPGPLAVGGSAPPITLTATISAAAGSTISNQASVSGTTYDRDPANNSGVAAAKVLAAGGAMPPTGADISRAVSLGVVLLGLGLALLALGSGRRRRV